MHQSDIAASQWSRLLHPTKQSLQFVSFRSHGLYQLMLMPTKLHPCMSISSHGSAYSPTDRRQRLWSCLTISPCSVALVHGPMRPHNHYCARTRNVAALAALPTGARLQLLLNALGAFVPLRTRVPHFPCSLTSVVAPLHSSFGPHRSSD
jgi:hypothetical protein